MKQLNISSHIPFFQEVKMNKLNTLRIVSSIYDTDPQLMSIKGKFNIVESIKKTHTLVEYEKVDNIIEGWSFSELYIQYSKKDNFTNLDEFMFYVFMSSENAYNRQIILENRVNIIFEKKQLSISEVEEQFDWGYYQPNFKGVLREFNNKYEFAYLYSENFPRLIGFQKGDEYWAFDYMGYN